MLFKSNIALNNEGRFEECLKLLHQQRLEGLIK